MQNPILIYTTKLSSRLDYICKFIFRDVLQLPFQFTTSAQKAKANNELFVNYSHEYFDNCITIFPHQLLFEEDINPQIIQVSNWRGMPIFFQNQGNDIPFDLFAAVFFCISRYEEYLPFTPDEFGRFPHQASLASKEHFLNRPLADEWCCALLTILTQKGVDVSSQKKFIKQNTFDIDMAFAYKGKGISRNIGGAFREIVNGRIKKVIERIKCCIQLSKDPFDNFKEIFSILNNADQQGTIFFILNAQQINAFDKNIIASRPAMKNVLNQILASKLKIGIHPSWQSHIQYSILKIELTSLSNSINQLIDCSRQHYIKFILPSTFEQLINVGVKNDFSMGYGSINGFRASTCTSFYWFNLDTNSSTNLKCHPFCWMDANSRFEQNYTLEQSELEYIQYENVIKKVNGQFISIWHNFIIGNELEHPGWMQLFKKVTV